MTTALANAARIVAELRERTKTEYGDLEDGDEFLEGSLEGATDLPELLAMMARDAVQAADYAEATKGRIKLLAERKSTLEARSEKLRNAIAWALAEAGWKRIPADALPDMGPVTLSYPKQPKLDISDEAFIPGLFRHPKPTEFTIDRDGLRKWLEDGGECIGARLKNAAPVLTIRSK